MERTRDTLLLALYALPDPPDGRLINRRARAAAKEHEGSAASRIVEVASCARGGGVERAPSPDAARANRRMDPVDRKRRGTGGDDGGSPQRVPDDCCLDATRKGRGAAGERFLKEKHRSAVEEGDAHGRLLHYRQDLDDRGKKRGRGGAVGGSLSIAVNGAPCSRDRDMSSISTAGEHSLKEKHRSGHVAEEEGSADGRLLLYRQGLDDRDKKHGGGGSVQSIAVNGAPCCRGVSTIAGERFSMEKHRRFCDAEEDGGAQGRFLNSQDLDGTAKKQGAGGDAIGSLASCAGYRRDRSHGFTHSDPGKPVTHNGWGLDAGIGFLNARSASVTSQVTQNGCLGFEEEVPCSSKAPDSHDGVGSHSSIDITCRPDLATAAQFKSVATTSKFADSVSFQPDLGTSAAQCKLVPSTSILADAESFWPDLGTSAQYQSMASSSTPADSLNFRPGLGAAPQRKSGSSTCRVTDAMNSQANLGAAQRKSDFTLTLSSATNKEERYDPVPELLLCSGEILSKPWRRIWQHSPLVFHDKQLVRCLVILGGATSGVLLNLTDHITNILEKHPGNICYFRLDSSCWTGGRSKLSEWLKMLSEKNAAEIIIINREEATVLEFPLEDLQSSCLRSLRLGFFTLSEFDIYSFEYSKLDTLELIGCSLETIRLFHVIKACRNLKYLGIGLAVKNLRISSESLEHIQIWRCNMQHLIIESAPKLQMLINGSHPKWKHQPVLLMIHDTPALQEFRNLLLPIHQVQDKLWMKNLKKISIGINMANQSQRELLCEYLQHASLLQELEIWRMDEIQPLEELDVPVDDSLLQLSSELPCFSTLQTLVIDGFRGGGAEISIIAAILKGAVGLKELRVHPCSTSDKELIVLGFLALRNMKKACTNCSVTFADRS